MRTYLTIAAVAYPIMLFIGQHFPKAGFERLNQLSLVVEHMEKAPFDIFPIDWNAFGITSYIFLVLCLLLYVEYLRRKRLRTTGEHGSSAWNTDLKAYNLQYADTKRVTFFEDILALFQFKKKGNEVGSEKRRKREGIGKDNRLKSEKKKRVGRVTEKGSLFRRKGDN